MMISPLTSRVGFLLALAASTNFAVRAQTQEQRHSPTTYVGQEVDLSSAPEGIFGLSTGQTHAQELPLPAFIARDPKPVSNSERGPRSAGEDSTAEFELSWWLTNTNGSVSVPALFPSQAHLELLRAGIIDDPNVGLNEGTTRWVGEEPTWTYTASLAPLLPHLQKYARQILYFQGLDTICRVSIGNISIGSTDNQFRSWRFDVTDALRGVDPAAANITLAFDSALEYAKKESSREPFFPNTQTMGFPSITTNNVYPNRIFVRKQSSDLGWDWGPAYVPAGPHKPAYLIGLGTAQAQDSTDDGQRSENALQTRQDLNGTAPKKMFVYESGIEVYRKGQANNLPPDETAPWILNVTMGVWSITNTSATVRLSVPELALKLDASNISAALSVGDNVARWAAFEVPSDGDSAPALWWPYKLGQPKLYDVDFELRPVGASSNTEATRWTKKTGFRTVWLDQSPVSPQDTAAGVLPGTYFRFVVNGKPNYIQGGSVTPFDVFYPRISTSVLKDQVDSAVAANQNLLRVWGGGSYQSTEFYDLADAAGMLVWSEALFASSLYPSYPVFADNVKIELAENVRRISQHPSNAIWVGNNEGA
ncbi:hypothetical protein IE81DRAFT_348038 [Ceraceosorus guamensis]|uniref:Beta-mannosidase A n=1 Tax=Ceraceosorus guamensis TaxID=1522189 RepID=A0A316VZY1_9BASI|nr:hypothetical protein IE81DRAFT_348038 [Ceraceosorus guamensis]PWN41851.1 hypothetical protein IE81DRAFT_348038 [Ceraceosorus guamensis]